MDKAVKRQVENGLRVGGGIAALLIGLMLLGDGFRRLWLTTVPYHFSFSTLGCIEQLLAAAILFTTASLWMPYFAGCMVLAILQAFLTLLWGQGFYTNKPVSRLESFAFMLFCTVTVLLLLRPLRERTTILDQLALTLYIFSFFWWGMQGFSFSLKKSPMLLCGPALLCISWVVEYWKSQRRSGAALQKLVL